MMASTLPTHPAVLAHPPARASRKSVASWSKLRPRPFSAAKRQRQRPASGLSLVVSASKKVLVPIANGSEEIEAVVIIDVLRRAGAEVTVASVEDTLQVEMSRQVKLVADKSIQDAAHDSYDAIALPGGMPGAERLGMCQELMSLLEKQRQSGRIWSAICASPAVVFEAQGWLEAKKATCHPAFVERLADQSVSASRVIVDGSLVTSRGPGTALEFALALVRELYGKAKEDEIAGPMVMQEYASADRFDSEVPA